MLGVFVFKIVLRLINDNLNNINPIKDSVTNGDVVVTIREKIEAEQKTGTILFVDSSGLPGNLQHAVVQYVNPKGTSNIYLEASFINSPRYYGWIAPNNNTPTWETYVRNSDLSSRFSPIQINGRSGDTFKNVLKGRSNNTVRFIAFASNPSDNPFSFSLGYAFCFHSGLITSNDNLTLFGFSPDASQFEVKRVNFS